MDEMSIGFPTYILEVRSMSSFFIIICGPFEMLFFDIDAEAVRFFDHKIGACSLIVDKVSAPVTIQFHPNPTDLRRRSVCYGHG